MCSLLVGLKITVTIILVDGCYENESLVVDIRMITWIDKYGDVVWNDDLPEDWINPDDALWASYLIDGCRLNIKGEFVGGVWMILK